MEKTNEQHGFAIYVKDKDELLLLETVCVLTRARDGGFRPSAVVHTQFHRTVLDFRLREIYKNIVLGGGR